YILFICHFFFTDTASPSLYTLSLHDALPISTVARRPRISSSDMSPCSHHERSEGSALWSMQPSAVPSIATRSRDDVCLARSARRSEEHTSELQSRENLVCRLLLEKKKKTKTE